MKKLMIAASLLATLVSCTTLPDEGGTLPNGGSSQITGFSGRVVEGIPSYNSSHTVTGITIKPWSYGAGTFNLVSQAEEQTVLASTPMAADGSFSLASLPAPDASKLRPYHTSTNPNCTDNYDISDKNYKSAGATGMVKVSQGTPTAQPFEYSVNAAGGTTSVWMLIYVDRSVTFSGSQRCVVNDSNIKTNITNMNISLKTGWNSIRMTETFNKTASELTISMTSAALPANWVVFNQ